MIESSMPDRIHLLGKEILIHYTNSASRNDTTMGRNDDKMLLITINEDMPRENKEEVLLHESIHMIDAHVALGLTEQQTTALSSVLYSFLKDNPAFITGILK